ncbi:nuclear transport factor 2 family protein [Marinifilum caeruleilacunae]|uniref:Nuclear transport factor 2 family protein n=1 Tax=Marinifilum caeruleilacunae TaxID=2499076 RepID=A0ABX1WQC0_9BACT|nr:nuclear transport factor 2 family protein [Marinifilum caeruleilacunae]NOU58277.1 nuclear transport factor 2 family protein [Marinifilum caeruleilacunae]
MRREIEDVVTKMFVYNDEHNWEGLASVFAPEVSMLHLLEGNESEHRMTPNEIVSAWRPIMEQFQSVHHQIGNMLLRSMDEQSAILTCYGRSTHYKTDGNVWEVVGNYEFKLSKLDGHWKIVGEIFQCKHQSGSLN